MIGVLDSGLGGVFCMRALRRALPLADLTCLCDQAHLPYGDKSPPCLLDCFFSACRVFCGMGASALLVACGTLSTVVVPTLPDPPLPLFDVVAPTGRRALQLTRSGHIAVLATERTAVSGTFRRALLDAGARRVTTVPCPAFVLLIEAGLPLSHPVLRTAVSRALTPLRDTDADVMLLGCTHYAYLAPVIDRCFGAPVVDGGAEAVRRLVSTLPAAQARGRGRERYLTTADPADLSLKLTRVLGRQPVCERAPAPCRPRR